MSRKAKRILVGIVSANAIGGWLMFLTWLLVRAAPPGGANDNSLFYVLSVFVLIPLVMGGLTAYLWDEIKLERGEAAGYSFLTLLVGLVLCTVVLREGMICILMASPLLILFQWLGYVLGKAIARRNSRRLNASLAPLVLFLLVADVLTARGFDGQVADSITIHAPPRTVWKYIAGYPAITAPPDYWLWKIGLPAPVQSVADGAKVGASRKCIFGGKIVMQERITRVVPEQELTFDVTGQPKDPEVIGHFVLHKGQFLLRDNGDGTTTVTGTTWYTLNVHPACYYDLWAQDIVRHVHLRVMRHIKALSEAKP